MIRCLIIDDEVNARNGLAEYVSEIPILSLAGVSDNAIKALDMLEHVDLIFLDIQMPGIDGINFLKTLKTPPLVILTTAFPEYALQGYELEVVDYLLKPITFDRFLNGVNKAHTLLQRKVLKKYDEFIFVKTDKGFERVENSDILFIEGLQNYVVIQCKSRQLVLYTTIKGIENFLNPGLFVRVQKSYIVNISKIDRFYKDDIIIQEKVIPISKKNRDEVMRKLFDGRSFKK